MNTHSPSTVMIISPISLIYFWLLPIKVRKNHDVDKYITLNINTIWVIAKCYQMVQRAFLTIPIKNDIRNYCLQNINLKKLINSLNNSVIKWHRFIIACLSLNARMFLDVGSVPSLTTNAPLGFLLIGQSTKALLFSRATYCSNSHCIYFNPVIRISPCKEVQCPL